MFKEIFFFKNCRCTFYFLDTNWYSKGEKNQYNVNNHLCKLSMEPSLRTSGL